MRWCVLITPSLLVLLVLSTLQAAWAAPIPSKCSACSRIAELLGKRLDAEVPRNHLDMRHRLDAQGKRYGKVIDYKISELRSIELLDSLCSDVKQGFDFNSTASVWVPTSEQKHGDSSLDRKENQRILDIYCGSVMEDHEEDLTDALRSGQLTEERVLDFLCREKAQVCSEAEVQARWPEATRSDSTDEVNTEL